MDITEAIHFILDKGGVAGLSLLLLWRQWKDHKEAIVSKDKIIAEQSSDAKEERKETFELMGALKTLMESINKKL